MSFLSKKLMATASTATASSSSNIADVFSIDLYTGNGGNQTINNGLDLSGEGGLVWTKNRNTTGWHHLYDTERGTTKILYSNSNSSEQSNSSTLTAFNSNGFTLGSNVGSNGANGEYVSWTFRKAPKFFDIQTWTGNGVAGREISHNLGTTVGMLIIKELGNANDWTVLHRSTEVLWLNQATAVLSGYAPYRFGDGSSLIRPTNTVFTLGPSGEVNGNGQTYVAYLFADNSSEDAENQMIKCGSINLAAAGGPHLINLGWEPQYVWIKRNGPSGGNWMYADTMRGLVADSTSTSNITNHFDTAAADDGVANAFGLRQNGFVVDSGQITLTDANNYIYMAIRTPMMAEPTDATEVFDIKTYQGASNFTSFSGLSTSRVDATANFIRSGYGAGTLIWSRLTGPSGLKTWSQAAEGDHSDTAQWDFNNKITITGSSTGSNGSQYVNYFWKRAKGYFDVVCYTGDGTLTKMQNHSLGVAPEMYWIKSRSDNATGWGVYHKDIFVTSTNPPSGYQAYLNLALVPGTSTANHVPPTATQFQVGSNTSLGGTNSQNKTNSTYISYLFATLAGISKVGSVVHSGNTNVDCGFSNGARFALVKRWDASGDWYVWDSVRGIVSGNDPYLVLNSNAAGVTNTDYIDPYSAGFTLTSSFTTGSYIFYAIA